MNAKQKGRADVKGSSVKVVRIYETDKAHKAYIEGIIECLRERYPASKIVRCDRDFTILAAVPQDGWNYDAEGNKKPAQHIECPTCGRRYFKEGDKYVSDRDLKFL